MDRSSNIREMDCSAVIPIKRVPTVATPDSTAPIPPGVGTKVNIA